MKNLKIIARAIYISIKYYGHNKFCPICKKYFSRFLTHGAQKRSNARCPFCSALERHRLLWLYIEKKNILSEVGDGIFLHVAPEPQFKKIFKKLLGNKYLTADLLAKDVDVRMDITNIQYKNESFEFIYCSHVLEHVLDDLKAMSEFHRVLTKTGQAIILVPISHEKTFEDPSIIDAREREKYFGQDDHVRCYGLDYIDRLKQSGFMVERITPNNFLTDMEINIMGITKEAGDIYLCKK